MTISPGEIKYCLESNFIINLLRGDQNAVILFEEIKNSPLSIASIASVVLFEILRGKETKQEKVKKFEELRSILEVLSFGEREAEEASQIEKDIHSKGHTISPLDLLIGATAKTHGAILVTNDKGFEKIDGLSIKTY
jgi:tRNA(fMet)-specific endonuclease VapC